MEQISITIPESWAEIKLANYQEYIEYVKNQDDNKPFYKKLVEIISILTDTDEEILYKLPYESLFEIQNNMKFLEDEPTALFKNIIEVKGKKYGFQKNLHQLSLGEWIDLEHYASQDIIQNLHYIAAILYRKVVSEGDEYFDYEIEDYKNVKIQGQAEMFKYELNVVDIYGIAVFFYLFINESLTNTLFCLNQEKMAVMTEQEMEQVLMNTIELLRDSEAKKRLKQLIEKSRSENGDGSISYTKLLTDIYSNMIES
jgi:hypothetical protein